MGPSCDAVLLAQGAAAGRVDREGRTPLHWVCSASPPVPHPARLVGLLAAARAAGRADSEADSLPTGVNFGIMQSITLQFPMPLFCIFVHLWSRNLTTENWRKLACVEELLLQGRTPLHWAVLAGAGPDLVKALLTVPACQPAARDLRGRTALHWAALAGRLELATLLAVSPEVPAVQDEGGATPLHLAVAAGSLETVRELVRCPDCHRELCLDQISGTVERASRTVRAALRCTGRPRPGGRTWRPSCWPGSTAGTPRAGHPSTPLQVLDTRYLYRFRTQDKL